MKLAKRFFVVFSSLFFVSHFLCAEIRLSKNDFKLFKDALKKVGEELKKTVGDKEAVKEAFKGHELTLTDLTEKLPVVKDIPLPSFIKKLMSSVKLKTPKFTKEGDAYELTEAISLGGGQDLQLRIYVGPGKQGKTGISYMIGIPGEWTLNELLPDVKKALMKLEESALPKETRKTLKKLKLSVEDLAKMADWLVFSNIGFGFGAPVFEDPVYGKMMSGLNVFANVKLAGPFEDITSMFGEDLTSLQYRGFLSPMLGNSEVRAVYPGKVSFLRIPLDERKDPLFHIRSSDLQFRIGLTDKMIPTIKGIGGFEILLPFQKDYIKFLTSIDYMGVKADVSGYTEGLVKNIFGMMGVTVGNLGFVLTLTPQPPPIPPVGGFGLRGELHFGKARLNALFKGDVRGDFALIASAKSDEGSITQKDVIDFVLGVIDGYAKIGKIKANVKKLKPLFNSVMLPFKIGDLEVYIVPTGIEVFDVKYAKGIYLEGSISFPSLSLGGAMKAQVSMTGVEMTNYLDAINLPKKNPIISITGASPTGGPIYSNALTLSKQISIMSGQVEIPPLGIKEKLHAEVGLPEGLDFEVQRKFGDLFDMNLHIVGNPKSLDTFYVEGYCRQDALDNISEFLQEKIGEANDEAQEDLKKARKNLTKARNSVSDWEENVQKDKDTWLNKRAKEIEKVERKIWKKAKSDWKACKKGQVWRCPGAGLKALAGLTLKGVKELARSKATKELAKIGVKAVSKTAKTGLKMAKGYVALAQKGIQAASDVADAMGKLVGGELNIRSIELKKTTLRDSIKTKQTAPVIVKGKILQRDFCQVYNLDLTDPYPRDFFEQIAKGLIQIFGPKKMGKEFADACRAM